MPRRTATVLRFLPAAMLALALAACSSTPGRNGAGVAIQDGRIIDDLRAPSRQNY